MGITGYVTVSNEPSGLAKFLPTGIVDGNWDLFLFGDPFGEGITALGAAPGDYPIAVLVDLQEGLMNGF